MSTVRPDPERLSTVAPVRLLSVQSYNDLLVRSVLATRPPAWMAARAAGWNGGPRVTETGGGRRGIPGPPSPPAGTRINTGDSEGVSVTPGRGPTRLGGRPRQYATPAESNRVRQRAYRARRRSSAEGRPTP
jgi:hypothetical protein